MKGVPAVYLGKVVDKAHFRVFVYAVDGTKKLVESWDDYERAMESGLWFSTKEDADSRIPVIEEKPKRVRKKPVSVITLEPKEDDIEDKDEPFIEEELIPVEPEVVNVEKDDFLPKASK